MKIFIDARYLRASFSGIGTYSELLIKALARIDHTNQYLILVHSSYRGNLELGENFEILEDKAPPVSMRTLFTLQNRVREYAPDVYHSLMPLWPLALGRHYKILCTVFDLQPLLDPLFTSGRSPLKRKGYDIFYQYSYRTCLTYADYLLTISYATKRDIARLVPNAAENVLTVHPGFDSTAAETPTAEQTARVREKFDLPERYILYLGSTRPNKNLQRMLDGFEELVKRHPDDENLRWVMVLKPDRFFDTFFATVRKKGLLRRVHIYDQVTELEKRVLYRNAQALYFVTRFEGFGLPVLEAQGHGLPVLASTHSALPEVVGKGGLLADPDDPTSMADQLEKLLFNAEIRESVIANGRQNLKRFSWDECAREVLNMYEHLLK